MKTLLQKLVIIAVLAITYYPTTVNAQCGAGYTNAIVNFDMHYFNNPLQPSPLNFAIGKNNMRLAWSGTNTFRGSVAEQTAYTGNDLEFVVSTGADTMIFDQVVNNVTFNVSDIDNRQILTLTALDASNLPVTITSFTRASGTVLTVSNTGVIATATASNTAVAATANTGTVLVSINGPVKKIILSFSRVVGSGTTLDSIYISDISVCNNNTLSGTFPNGYQLVATPEIGQPSYILASYGDSIVAYDVTNNTVNLLYEVGNTNLIDTLFAPSINSLAYDPYKQIVYFADNARTPRNKSIYKYNIRTGVKSTWVADVTTLGIQLFANGMGSGGASFYDGDLYIGQDMLNVAGISEPVTVYRIDIDANGNPGKASRVWSKLGYGGSGNTLYDWADFVINNGVFYNFNSASGRAANTGIEHINLNTNAVTVGYSATAVVNGSQCGVNYLGNIYHIYGTDDYSVYNGAGGFGTVSNVTGVGTRSLTDAAEAFKYPYDFSDGPAAYGIAFHLFRTSPNLMIGTMVDYEMNDTINSTASADDIYNTGSANDEDGVTTFPPLTASNTTYTVNVRTTNSTGAVATLYGFVDFNRDGDFNDAGERSNAATVPNGATPATPIAVNFVGLTGGSIGASFMRFRLASNATEASSRTGYAASGEVEDYPIAITASALPVELVQFTATANENRTTLLSWATASELNNDYFEVQRKENNSWVSIGKVSGKGFSNTLNTYTFTDVKPESGINYYQLKQVDFDSRTEYSPMVSVTFDDKEVQTTTVMSLYPNPTTNDIWIKTDKQIDPSNLSEIEIFNITGEKLQTTQMQENTQRIDLNSYQSGMYFIKIGKETYRVVKQ